QDNNRDRVPRAPHRRRGGAERGKPLPERIVGRVRRERDGSAHLIPDDANIPLVYLPPEEAEPLKDRERVTVRIEIGRKGRARGPVIARGARSPSTVVGVVRMQARGVLLVPEPEGPALVIPDDELHGARDGEAVVARVTHEASHDHPAEATVLEVLGRIDEPP